MTGPRYTPTVAALPATVPFVGPEAQERARGAPFAARLGANESGFGPAPSVRAAIAAASADVWMYGDPEGFALRHALAAHHGTDAAHIVLGCGVDGLLGTVVRLLVGPGDPVVTSRGGYPTFAYHARAQGGALTEVPYRDDAEDIAALWSAARKGGARMVYLANPDNPMGSWHPGPVIAAALEDLPEGCLLVLDEAYAELAPDGALPEIAADDPRVIRLRSFSKAHGLAGLRVGYAIAAPGLIAAFDRIRDHFGVGRLAQAAALAALADRAWLTHVQSRVAGARARIASIAQAQGLTPLPSATNFVTLDCGGDGAFAQATLAGLTARGLFVRMPGVAPLDRCIRVSCAPSRDLDVFEAALPGALADARKR